MAIVLLLDQRSSSGSSDLVGPVSRALNQRYTDALKLEFVRTAGDEMQAVLGDPSELVAVLADVLEHRAWWVGVGLGEIARIEDTARASAGPVFKAARSAIDAAKRDRGSSGPAVRGEPKELAESLQAALAGWAFIRAKRTRRQREVVAATGRAQSRRGAAQQLGVTPQAVSDALTKSGYEAEQQLAALITRIAAQAAGSDGSLRARA